MHAVLVSVFMMVAPAPHAPKAQPRHDVATKVEALKALAAQAVEVAQSAGIDLVAQPSFADVLARAATP